MLIRVTPGSGDRATTRRGDHSAPSDLDRLLDRPVSHIRWGLERISRMLEELGGPHRAFAALHVGGTNGKGSVCAVAATLADAAGPIGLYTSPHLTRFAERIRVDGREAEDDLLERCAARVAPLADREGATYFEAATALAFLAFAEVGVELAVIEVGLGGRLDATNIVTPQGCCVVTVGLDHCEYLGDSLAAVAAEKAGIIKSGVPVVLGELPPEAQAVLVAKASEVKAPVYALGRRATISRIALDSGGTSFTYRSRTWPEGQRLRVPLPGAHQAHNAGVALLLLEETGRLPDPASVGPALERVHWPGRMEWWETGRVAWVLDAAHNPAGAEALVAALRELRPTRPLVILAAMLRRKAWPEILDTLRPSADAVVLTTTPSHPADAAWDLRVAAAHLRGSGEQVEDRSPLRVEVSECFGRALDRARELAGGGTVVVTGSSYLVGDVRQALTARGNHRGQSETREERG